MDRDRNGAPHTPMPHITLSRRQWLAAVAGTAAVAGAERAAAQDPLAHAPRDLSTGMHVAITGSGAALPVPERALAGAAVAIDGTFLQFDCGSGTMRNQIRAGINPAKVDYLFFTHLHFDHMGEFGYYIISSWISGRRQPIQVFGPIGAIAMADGIVYKGHHTDVDFVTKRASGQGGQTMQTGVKAPMDVKDVGAGVVLETDRFKVTAVETQHILVVGPHRSLAYRVDTRYGSVVISGDTAPSQAVADLAKGADLLVHECTYPPPGVINEGSFSRPYDPSAPGTGHTAPFELGKIAAQAQVKKVVATHLGLYTGYPAGIEMAANYFGKRGVGPEIWPAIAADIRKSYSGPIVLAEDALVIPIGH